MSNYTVDELKEGLRAINSVIYKCEKAKEKFPNGTPHHTLLNSRLKAMYISKDLILVEISKKEIKKPIATHCEEAPVFLDNIYKLHTTPLGADRIRKNLNADVEDITSWCKEVISKNHLKILNRGKNWYIETEEFVFTVNRKNYNIITAHKRKHIDIV